MPIPEKSGNKSGLRLYVGSSNAQIRERDVFCYNKGENLYLLLGVQMKTKKGTFGPFNLHLVNIADIFVPKK